MSDQLQDRDIIRQYILAMIAEFPDLNDALGMAKAFRIDVNKRIDKNLTPEKIDRIKTLIEAMNSELNGGKKWGSTAGIFG